MKFLYQYRTSDNVEHQGEIDASNRDAAFAALKKQGIKPGRMWEKPGFFNKLFGRGKRWIAIAVLAVVSVVSICLFVLEVRDNKNIQHISSERHQIWGDEVVIKQAEKNNWRVIFPNPADRLLSLFAQPGFMLPVFPRIPKSIHDDFTRALAEKTVVSENDLEEYKQMKLIVEGMKDELRAYIKDGGNIDGYLKRLVARQREEADFVEKAKEDLNRRIERGEDPFNAWQTTNKFLREQGLKSVPMPTD